MKNFSIQIYIIIVWILMSLSTALFYAGVTLLFAIIAYGFYQRKQNI